MRQLSKCQKEALSNIYKVGRKLKLTECHSDFLSKELEMGLVPKGFRIKVDLPGDKSKNQEKLDKLSTEIMEEELAKLRDKKLELTESFSNATNVMKSVFDMSQFESNVIRVKNHMDKIGRKKQSNHMKKIHRDVNLLHVPAQSAVFENENVINDKHKKKRRFKRKYLQPKPKRRRKRKRSADVTLISEDGEKVKWNTVIKNFTGNPISEAEKTLFSKGKKFCPVELDPPIQRMKSELNVFLEILD